MKNKILILVLFTGLYACNKNANNTIKPVYRKMTEAVYASGNIYPDNDYKIFANADGYLVESMVQEGDVVRKDQSLFRIESDKEQIRMNTSQDIYNKALENYQDSSYVMKEQYAMLQSIQSRFKNDSVNYERQKNLLKNNATSQAEFDRAQLNFIQSKNDLTSRLNAIKKLKNQLYVELKNAENQYKVNAKEASNFTVKSFIPGIIYEIYKRNGEPVRRTEAIALAGDGKNFYIKLNVDELDIQKVQLGQEVLLTADIDKSKVYKAKVVKIYPKLTKETQSFRVDAKFTDEVPPSLYGLTVEANIIIHQKDKVLSLQKDYMAGTDSVWVSREGKEEKIKINKGFEDFDFVEILGGIDSSSVIIKK